MDVESVLQTLWKAHDVACSKADETDFCLDVASQLLNEQLCSLNVAPVLEVSVETLSEDGELTMGHVFEVLCSNPLRAELVEIGMRKILECLPLFCDWLAWSENHQAARTLVDIVSLPGASLLCTQDMRRTLRVLVATLQNLLDTLDDEGEKRPIQRALSSITHL